MYLQQFFLIIAVFLSYTFFERSLRTDIYFYSHEINRKIIRITSGELRRYSILKDMGKTIYSKKTEEDLREDLQARSKLFYKDGELKNLVSSIGYFYRDSPEKAFEYVFMKESWQDLSNVFNKESSSPIRNLLFDQTKKEENIYIIDEFQDGNALLFFKVDQKSFINEYIKTAVEEAFPDMLFVWKDETTNHHEIKKPDNKEKYDFRPFRTLFGFNKNTVKPLVLELPAFFDLKDQFLDEGEKKDRLKIDKEMPPFFNSKLHIEVFSNKGSYYYTIEKKAAIAFLETLVIIILTTALFVLLAVQLQKTRLLRYKEKQFVASVTHELRTPLTVIIAAADNLGSGVVPKEKIQEYSKMINEQSKRLGIMIEEILEYSRFEGNKNRGILQEECNLKQLFSDIRNNFNEITASNGISIKWNVGNFPELVETHPATILLVVENLITNAINHAYNKTEPSPLNKNKQLYIRVGVKFLISGILEITVEDDGRGISTKEGKHIFEPFYRGAESQNLQEKGSGLGLFIAKRKAEISGGRLILESPYKLLDGSLSYGCKFVLALACNIKKTREN